MGGLGSQNDVLEVAHGHVSAGAAPAPRECPARDYDCLLRAFEHQRRERWVQLATVELLADKLARCVAKNGIQQQHAKCKDLAVEYMKRVSEVTGYNIEVSPPNLHWESRLFGVRCPPARSSLACFSTAHGQAGVPAVNTCLEPVISDV